MIESWPTALRRGGGRRLPGGGGGRRPRTARSVRGQVRSNQLCNGQPGPVLLCLGGEHQAYSCHHLLARLRGWRRSRVRGHRRAPRGRRCQLGLQHEASDPGHRTLRPVELGGRPRRPPGRAELPPPLHLRKVRLRWQIHACPHGPRALLSRLAWLQHQGEDDARNARRGGSFSALLSSRAAGPSPRAPCTASAGAWSCRGRRPPPLGLAAWPLRPRSRRGRRPLLVPGAA